MPEINPLTKDQLFEKKIAENTGSNYNVGGISDVVPVTKDQSLLKEIALNSAGLSEDITELEGKVAANAEAIEAIENVYGSKNLLPTVRSGSKNGAILTVNADGSFTITGNPTEYTSFTLYNDLNLPAGQYILSGIPSGGGADKWGINCEVDGTWLPNSVWQGGATSYSINVSSIINQVTLIVYPKTDGDYNLTFYPMIRDARIADSTYVPYAMTNRELTERVEKSPEYVADLNNLLKPGFYMTGTGVTNTPNDNDNHFINNGLFVSGNGVNYCAQMIIDNRNQLFSRICNNGTWTSWEGYTKA